MDSSAVRRVPIVLGPGEGRAGSFVLFPGHTPHDVENRGAERAGFLNLSVPGGFEPAMPEIAAWFLDRSHDDSRA